MTKQAYDGPLEKQGHIFRPAAGGLINHHSRYPGFISDPDTQRIDVSTGRGRHIALGTGDLVEIVNQDGGSTIEVLPINPSGAFAPELVGLATLPASPLNLFDDREFIAWQQVQGANQLHNRAIKLFDRQTQAGEQFILQARSRVDVWLINPEPTPQQIATEGAGGHFIALIKRASREVWDGLPDPLGVVRFEERVPAASARAYEVKAGEFIQVIDVAGRQCTDFMAMRASALDAGLERFIDGTATRSMVGGAYPGPGLFDKFYDQDLRPLLAVTQDTVGRHDTFALACTERGYEERGFPGHINCSDNISAVYSPFGIQQRKAWPAVNFFFNSAILPSDNRIRVDEAWSRPGDYVVMQALTDLVCVSTACPDDVDPINGWNPTDVHVRVYREDSAIRRAIAHRPTPDSEPIMSQDSAFHPATSKLTNAYATARDLWLPAQYDGIGTLKEYWACREAVTLQDMSSLRKFDILGPDAETLLQLALTKDVSRLAVHRGFYGLICDVTGTVIDDGTLFRLAPDVFRWACGAEESGEHLRKLAADNGLKVWIKSLSSGLPNLALQGPKSRDLLREVIFTQPNVPALDHVKWFGSTVARLDHREGPSFLLTRSGYTGELGYEIFCAEKDATRIWDRLMEAGVPYGITPMGGHALEIIRIEAGLMAANAEFAPQVDAFEAGLGFAVDFRKPKFVGREALLRASEHPKAKLVGLTFEGQDLPEHGDGVFDGRRQIGTITSATRSPSLNSAIAMARVAVEYGEVGSKLEVGRLDHHMKRLPCSVVNFPFVDPTRARARA